jgi:hypothetical protein
MHRTVLHFLDDIKEAAGNIKKYTKGITYEQFLSDRRTQDAVVRNFEVIGEAAKNLPEDLKARYPGVAWKQVAGLRAMATVIESPSPFFGNRPRVILHLRSPRCCSYPQPDHLRPARPCHSGS